MAVAIDFGSHGSGYAWTAIDERSRLRQHREVFDKTDWPSGKMRYPKTLSAVLRNQRTGELLAWGYPAYAANRERYASGKGTGSTEGIAYISGIKMSLRTDEDPAASALDRSGADPVPVITDYLRELSRVAIAEVTASGVYRESDIRWCLTVPAIWNQVSMQRMRQAAAQAGLPSDYESLLLLPEPDAAAIYCNVTGALPPGAAETSAWRGLQVAGTRFMVADCGGGTADLVCYEVGDGDKLDQLTRPSGGPYGAEFTTKKFLFSLLRERFGDMSVLEQLEGRSWREFDMLIHSWERDRDQFTGLSSPPFILPIPSRLHRELGTEVTDRLASVQDSNNDDIVIPAGEVADLLDSVIEPILAKVDEQFALLPSGTSGLDYVYLVGGFAKSPYLQRRLAEHVGTRARVLVPQSPERAVLHGAAHYGADPASLHHRRSVSTYGIGCFDEFTDEDPAEYLYITKDDRRRCTNRFFRFVAVSEKVLVGHEIEQVVYPVEEGDTPILFQFMASPDPAPRYITDPGMQQVGAVTVPLDGTLHLPLTDRSIRLFLKFGTAEIQVRAVVEATGVEVQTTVEFLSTY